MKSKVRERINEWFNCMSNQHKQLCKAFCIDIYSERPLSSNITNMNYLLDTH